MEKYRKQLYTYVLGLRDENHKFKDQQIDELKIYAIRSKELLPILYNEFEIQDMADNISNIASNIESSKFQSVDSKHCNKCQYLKLCKSDIPNIELPKIKCPECGFKVPVGSKFCSECGHDFSPKRDTECPKCGNELEPGMKFCPECGTKL